jgi:hypothetical protein
MTGRAVLNTELHGIKLNEPINSQAETNRAQQDV